MFEKEDSMSKRTWTIDDLKVAVKNSSNMASALRRLGLRVSQGNYITINKYIESLKIDNEHWRKGVPSYRSSATGREFSIEEVFVEHSSYSSTSNLKKKILKYKLLENKCSLCGLKKKWKGKPLVLILDHINGVRNDNRLFNLRLVCPNCNSQLETHCGKNTKRPKYKIRYYCKSCEKELRGKRKTGLCFDCLVLKKRNKEKKSLVCLECKKEIDKRSKTRLCITCSNKKKRKVNRPNKEKLKKEIDSSNWKQLGKKYGVSDMLLESGLRATI